MGIKHKMTFDEFMELIWAPAKYDKDFVPDLWRDFVPEVPEEPKKDTYTAFESFIAEVYGAGPLPVGLDKNKFRIKKLIQKSKGEK